MQIKFMDRMSAGGMFVLSGLFLVALIAVPILWAYIALWMFPMILVTEAGVSPVEAFGYWYGALLGIPIVLYLLGWATEKD